MKLLLLRKDSKSVILSVCREMLKPGQQADLSTIAKILDMLNKVYQQHLEKEVLILVSWLICMYSVLFVHETVLTWTPSYFID